MRSAARVRHLFSSGSASAADEQEMDARVGRMARELLCDPAISSRGGLEGMPEALADSHMPRFPHEPGDYLDHRRTPCGCRRPTSSAT